MISGVPKPDPRKSSAKKSLWKYWFKDAKPAVSEPSEQFMKACASLASRPYSYEQNWLDARQLAKQVKPEDIWKILAVMVHPPLPLVDIEPWIWLPRIQLAAAELVANVEIANNIPIEQSALAEVMRGPIDWTADAAVIALTKRMRELDGNSDWLCRQFFDLLNRVPKDGYWSTQRLTLHHILLLPNLAEGVRPETEAILESLNAEAQT